MPHSVVSPRFTPATPSYGGDWNPEQWDEEVVERDIELMQQAGVTLVSLGIFSWARMEPTEGTYDLDWLGALIDRLHGAGIDVDLATGTASPPAWMASDHPESLPVDARGVRLGFGSRQQYCPSSRVYRERSAALAGELARRFGNHPGVVLWHVGNEYACHVHECFCEVCATDFRVWLQERYVDIEGLNAAWGTDFWSQRYGSFDQITPPAAMPTFHNPAQALDWRRFSDHQIRGCMSGEIAAIREHSDRPVTTNFMGAFPWLDYRKWAQELDVISDDSYPDPADPAAAHEIAWQGDVMRGLGGGAPWLLMEQAPNAVQWRTRNSPKRPGQYLLWSLARLAHGADAVLQFQWRQSCQGAETFHSGMVPHAGAASRTWDDVVQVGDVLSRLGDVIGTRSRARVAVVIDWESEWARAAAIGPTDPGEPFAQARAWHRTFWEAGIAVDVVGAESDLEGYSLVVAPALFMDRPGLASELERVAAGGAQVLVTGPTGVVGVHMEAVLGGYLGSFRELLGVRVADHAALTGPVGLPADSRSVLVDRLSRAVGAPGACTWTGISAESPSLTRSLERIDTPTPDLRAGMWAEVLAPLEEVSEQGDPGDLPLAGVEVVATFDGRGGGVDLAGLPAITHRLVTAAPEVGSAEEEPECPGSAGGAWYVACDLDAPSRAALVQVLAAHARVRPVVDGLPDGVEAQRRGDILFLLNHGEGAAEVTGVVGTDLVSGAQCTGHVVLAPRSGMVVAQ